MQQVPDRGLSVFRRREAGDIGRNGIVDRFDFAFRDGDADQHRRDRLRHRLREETIAIGARVLIVLIKNGVVFCDQQPGGRVAAEIVLDREAIRPEGVRDRRLGRPLEQPGRRGALHRTRRKDLAEMAVGSDEVLRLTADRAIARRENLRRRRRVLHPGRCLKIPARGRPGCYRLLSPLPEPQPVAPLPQRARVAMQTSTCNVSYCLPKVT